MPDFLYSLFVLAIIFIVSFAICLFISVALLHKHDDKNEKTIPKTTNPKPKRRRKKRNFNNNAVIIKGTFLSPEEFNNKR